MCLWQSAAELRRAVVNTCHALAAFGQRKWRHVLVVWAAFVVYSVVVENTIEGLTQMAGSRIKARELQWARHRIGAECHSARFDCQWHPANYTFAGWANTSEGMEAEISGQLSTPLGQQYPDTVFKVTKAEGAGRVMAFVRPLNGSVCRIKIRQSLNGWGNISIGVSEPPRQADKCWETGSCWKSKGRKQLVPATGDALPCIEYHLASGSVSTFSDAFEEAPTSTTQLGKPTLTGFVLDKSR